MAWRKFSPLRGKAVLGCFTLCCWARAALTDVEDHVPQPRVVQPGSNAAAPPKPSAPPPAPPVDKDRFVATAASDPALRGLVSNVRSRVENVVVDPFAPLPEAAKTQGLELRGQALALAQQCVDRRFDVAFLDNNLHMVQSPALSRRAFQSEADSLFHEFPFDTRQDSSFLFLELGSGVGAFSRLLLDRYPGAVGIGIELNKQAAAVANLALEKDVKADRFFSVAGSMQHLSNIAGFSQLVGKVDYIFMSGSLCQLETLKQVEATVREAVSMLKPGGHIIGNSLPEAQSGVGSSCKVVVPKDFWHVQAMCGCYDVEHVAPMYELLEEDDVDREKLECRYLTHIRRKSAAQTTTEQLRCQSCNLEGQLAGAGHFMWFPGYGGVGDACKVDYFIQSPPFGFQRCSLLLFSSVCTIVVMVVAGGSILSWMVDNSPEVVQLVRQYWEMVEKATEETIEEAASKMRNMRDTVVSIPGTVKKTVMGA